MLENHFFKAEAGDSKDKVHQLMAKRNLGLKSLPQFADSWDSLFAELKDPSTVRKMVLKNQKYKGKFKFIEQGKVSVHIKKTPDFRTRKFEFLTPSSYSLVPQHGKIIPYNSAFNSSFGIWLHTGILVDITLCKQKPYIFSSDGATGSYNKRNWDVKIGMFDEE